MVTVLLTFLLGVLLWCRPAVQAVSGLLSSQNLVVSGHGVSVVNFFIIIILQGAHPERLQVKGHQRQQQLQHPKKFFKDLFRDDRAFRGLTCPATPPLRAPPRVSPNSRLLVSDCGLNRSMCSAAPPPSSARPGSRPRYPSPLTPTFGVKSTGVTSFGAKVTFSGANSSSSSSSCRTEREREEYEY